MVKSEYISCVQATLSHVHCRAAVFLFYNKPQQWIILDAASLDFSALSLSADRKKREFFFFLPQSMKHSCDVLSNTLPICSKTTVPYHMTTTKFKMRKHTTAALHMRLSLSLPPSFQWWTPKGCASIRRPLTLKAAVDSCHVKQLWWIIY